jgi:hypothetical protein
MHMNENNASGMNDDTYIIYGLRTIALYMRNIMFVFHLIFNLLSIYEDTLIGLSKRKAMASSR